MSRPDWVHQADGAGLKVVGALTHKWYGPGYCGICGHRGTIADGSLSPLLPIRVRWWDPDDGWKSGVLCEGCGIEAAARGPRADDYAVQHMDPEERAAVLDAITQANPGDDDAAHTQSEDT